MTKQIVGICGFIGSGKDTSADYLVNFHGFKRESFAATLKDAVSSVFGWDREMLEGRTKTSREWREQVDTWWSERLGMQITPRHVLQYWGTNVLRQHFHGDIWIASLENKLRSTKDNIVISDCRFPNEIRALRNQGGRIVWIKRGEIPTWYQTAVMANQGEIAAKVWLEQQGVHASEYSWAGTEFDVVVENNGTITELFDQLRNLAQDPQHAKEVVI